MKRLLSLVLALSLIISVAPMSFAIKSTETQPAVDPEFSKIPGMYFNFSAANWENQTADMTKSDIDANDADTAPKFATVNTDPWRIAGVYNVKDYRITSAIPSTDAPNAKANALYWEMTKSQTQRIKSSVTNAYSQAGSGFAVGVYINETGVFTPTITYETSAQSCYHSFFLAPREVRGNDYSMNSAHVVNMQPTVGALKGSPGASAPLNSALLKLGDPNMYVSTGGGRVTYDEAEPITINEKGWYYLYILPFRQNATTPQLTSSNYYMNLYSIELTPEPEMTADAAFKATEDPDYTSTNSASVTRLAYYGDDVAAETIGDVTTVNYGESLTIDGAEKTVTKGDKTYNFSYWAKGLNTGVGNKQILSTSLSFDYKPSEGTNYLIAVYEDAENPEEAFYNYNGQLLSDLSIGEDGTLPALPAMAGLGNAIGWEQLGTGDVFEAGYDVSELEGDKVFMAKYNEPEADITINGESYSYGDVVSCKDIVDSMENFSYFTRKIGSGKEEIMSIDPDYSFSAYTDCTIEAVCNGSVSEEDLGRAARKILFSAFSVGENLTAVMAEFIGFDGAKEKGIMFGSQKIAMTTDKNQFTVTNDTIADVTVTGYAIVDEDGTTVKYTDGSISVAGVK